MQKGSAIDKGPARIGASSGRQVRDRAATGIFTRMTSASRDPAAEQQLPIGIVENSLSGRGRMKSFCFLTIVIASDCHTRNAGGIGPKVCFYPIICHAWGFEEEYVHA